MNQTVQLFISLVETLVVTCLSAIFPAKENLDTQKQSYCYSNLQFGHCGFFVFHSIMQLLWKQWRQGSLRYSVKTSSRQIEQMISSLTSGKLSSSELSPCCSFLVIWASNLANAALVNILGMIARSNCIWKKMFKGLKLKNNRSFSFEGWSQTDG